MIAALPRWLLALAIVGSALAIGSVDARVLSVVAVVLLAGNALAWRRRASALRPSARLLLAASVGLTAVTLLQLLPIAASSHAAEIWRGALSPFGETGVARAMTLDIAATKVEVLRGVVYVSALLLSLRVAVRDENVKVIEGAVLGSALAVGAVTLVHQSLGLHAVYALYTPKQPDVTIMGPLLNVNQFSGYLVLGACVALGSLLSDAPLAPRPWLALALLALVAGVIWLGSRGATLGLVAGVSTVVVLTSASRRPKNAIASVLVPTGAACAGLGMVAFAASPMAARELGDTDVSKLHVQLHALSSMARAFPWIGCGRGSFESVFPEYRFGQGHVVWTHPENVVVQWTSEWGILVTLVAMVAIAFALRPSVALERARASSGPYTALVALALQNLVDFSSEIPGVMIALVACAGAVTAGSGDARPSRPRALVGAVAVCTALAIALGLHGFAHDLTRKRAELQRASVDPKVTNEAFFAELREEMLLHPAEPYFPYLGAARTLLFVPDGNVVPWIDRTLERAPVYPPAHLLLARWLRKRNPNQALLEYRLAAEQNGGQVGAEAESLVRSFEDALELAPEGKASAEVLESVSFHVAQRLPATSARLDEEILSRDKEAIQPRLRRARGAYVDFAGPASWCDWEDCAKVALDAAKDAQRAETSEPHVFEARVRVARGDKGALATLGGACDRVSDRAACLRVLAEIAVEAKDDARATDAIQRLSDAACADQADCVANITAAAGLEERRGHRAQALLLYRRAAEQAPERDDLLELVAAHAKGAGLHAFAADAYGKLAVRHPENRTYQELADDERRLASRAQR